MKCPKCKYISFDYNDRCPHCNKDLTSEKSRFDLVAFKHNPPFLLGSLTGDSGDIEPSLEAGTSSVHIGSEEEDLDLHLDGEDLSESLPKEELSLDLVDLEDEIIKSEDNALESFGSGKVSLDETIPELPAGQGGAPSDSAEIVTTEIDRKKRLIPRDQEEVEGEVALEEFEKPGDESS